MELHRLANSKKTLKGHTNKVFSVVFSADGKTLASGSSDNTIRLWDVEAGTLRNTLNLIEFTEEVTEIGNGNGNGVQFRMEGHSRVGRGVGIFLSVCGTHRLAHFKKRSKEKKMTLSKDIAFRSGWKYTRKCDG